MSEKKEKKAEARKKIPKESARKERIKSLKKENIDEAVYEQLLHIESIVRATNHDVGTIKRMLLKMKEGS